MNVKYYFFIIIFIVFLSFPIKVKASTTVQEFVSYANVKTTIETETTILPYKQINEDNKQLKLISTIYSKDSWINDVIELSLTKLGCKYSQEYREAQTTFDCSSFTRRMYEEVTGVYIGSTTYDISDNLWNYQISFDEIQPGDLLWLKGHIAMYIGNNEIIHATGYTDNICIEQAFGRINFTNAFRPINYIKDIIK